MTIKYLVLVYFSCVAIIEKNRWPWSMGHAFAGWTWRLNIKWVSFSQSSSHASFRTLHCFFSFLFFSYWLYRWTGWQIYILHVVHWCNADSCSVYGTGRIHCEGTLSVNYHRAINRAEKEPLDDPCWKFSPSGNIELFSTKLNAFI